MRDYTLIPQKLEQVFAQSSCVRPVIITPDNEWPKLSSQSLLQPLEASVLGTEELKTEKNKAFDLIDALSKSGAISIDHSTLHVVIVQSHTFDKSVMDCLVEDGLNPIEDVEKTVDEIASLILEKKIQDIKK